jgi:hypothetical protein
MTCIILYNKNNKDHLTPLLPSLCPKGFGDKIMGLKRESNPGLEFVVNKCDYAT